MRQSSLSLPPCLPCRSSSRRVWARVVRMGVPPLHDEARQGRVWEVHTHAHAHRHTRTHTKLRVISAGTRRSPRRPLLSLRMHSASLQGGPPWAPGWGCSERGLCPSLPLFQAALFFPPHALQSHTLLPFLSIHPFSPITPEAQIVLLGFPRKRGPSPARSACKDCQGQG